MRPLSFLVPLLALLAPVAGRAQSVHWEPAGGTLAAGQVTTLQLVFDGCEPKDTPVPPKVSGLTLQYQSQASNIEWVNGNYSRSVTYTYAVLLTQKRAVDIPAFNGRYQQGQAHCGRRPLRSRECHRGQHRPAA